MVVSSRPRACKKLHQHAHLVVDLLDQPHIGRDDLFARLVARHVPRVAHVHIGREYRMRFLPFLLRADRRLHVGGAVHAGVGFGCDIGPVRFDVGQMQAPRPAVLLRLGDKIHRAAGHVGRLGMLFRNSRGLVGMDQQPAVLQCCHPHPRRNWPNAPRDSPLHNHARASKHRSSAAAARSDAGRRRAHRAQNRIATHARR